MLKLKLKAGCWGGRTRYRYQWPAAQRRRCRPSSRSKYAMLEEGRIGGAAAAACMPAADAEVERAAVADNAGFAAAAAVGSDVAGTAAAAAVAVRPGLDKKGTDD